MRWLAEDMEEYEPRGVLSHDEADAFLAEEDSSLACTDQPSARRPLTRRRGWIAVGLSISLVFALCSFLALRWPGRRSGNELERLGDLRGVEKKFDVAGMIKMLWGNEDPFNFQCPPPMSLMITSIGSIFRSSSHLMPNASSSPKTMCCQAYAKSWWPYQYPECAGAGSCSSCWRVSSDSELAAKPATGGLAGVAWAASAAAYQDDFKLKPLQMPSLTKPMLAQMDEGLHPHVTNVCPKVSDWHEYTFEFSMDKLRVRAYKSDSAKLALITFRGTEPTDFQNWMVDLNVATEKLNLSASGPVATVHKGYLDALRHLMPRVKKWVDGYILGWGKVPDDWKLVFTGHSMGAAFAILASTLVFSEKWERKPDAIITFAAPRIGDRVLADWWQQQGLCDKTMRVNVYNDVVTWIPFSKQSNMFTSLEGCVRDMKSCFKMQPSSIDQHFDGWWRHVCPSSEFLVPGAMKGVNEEIKDFSILGGALVHKLENCRFGYGYGVLHAGIATHDHYCGISPALCPRFSCTVIEDLKGQQCAHLSQNNKAKTAAECRESCCQDEDGSCEVWQWMKPRMGSAEFQCWIGRSNQCTKITVYDVVESERIK